MSVQDCCVLTYGLCTNILSTATEPLSGPSVRSERIESRKEYETRRSEFDGKHKAYCSLSKKIQENSQLFQNLANQLSKASNLEQKKRIAKEISALYHERIDVSCSLVSNSYIFIYLCYIYIYI